MLIPKVTTDGKEMYYHILKHIGEDSANAFRDGYNNLEFYGLYCENLIYTENLKFIEIFHELLHHFFTIIKNLVKSEKIDIIQHSIDLTDATIFRNRIVFNFNLEEIKKLI